MRDKALTRVKNRYNLFVREFWWCVCKGFLLARFQHLPETRAHVIRVTDRSDPGEEKSESVPRERVKATLDRATEAGMDVFSNRCKMMVAKRLEFLLKSGLLPQSGFQVIFSVLALNEFDVVNVIRTLRRAFGSVYSTSSAQWLAERF